MSSTEENRRRIHAYSRCVYSHLYVLYSHFSRAMECSNLFPNGRDSTMCESYDLPDIEVCAVKSACGQAVSDAVGWWQGGQARNRHVVL